MINKFEKGEVTDMMTGLDFVIEEEFEKRFEVERKEFEVERKEYQNEIEKLKKELNKYKLGKGNKHDDRS
jgi:SMC interacting uncharacterized protein involved in chromosome segregation